MKLNCQGCRHDFEIDEYNIDTEKIDCPKCSWPVLIQKNRMSHGYFGHFIPQKVRRKIKSIKSRWLRNDET